MDSRQRVIQAMRRQSPDRVPIDLSWGLTRGMLDKFKQHAGEVDPADYFELDVRFVSPELSKGWGATPGVDDEGGLDPLGAAREEAFRPFLPDFQTGDSITEWGVGHRRGSEHHFIHFLHPLARIIDPAELERYPFPAFTEDWRWQRVDHQTAAFQQRGLCVGGMAASSIFETAWMLRGMERLLEDFYLQPELAGAILDQVTAVRCCQARRLVGSGVDILVLGDDVATQTGMMLSPRLCAAG